MVHRISPLPPHPQTMNSVPTSMPTNSRKHCHAVTWRRHCRRPHPARQDWSHRMRLYQPHLQRVRTVVRTANWNISIWIIRIHRKFVKMVQRLLALPICRHIYHIRTKTRWRRRVDRVDWMQPSRHMVIRLSSHRASFINRWISSKHKRSCERDRMLNSIERRIDKKNEFPAGATSQKKIILLKVPQIASATLHKSFCISQID